MLINNQLRKYILIIKNIILHKRYKKKSKTFLFFLRFYLFINERHRERERQRERERERQRHRQREKQAPCREPNVGLNPRTPGSRPEPKADAQPTEPPWCS